jgi:hypothetical protein
LRLQYVCDLLYHAFNDTLDGVPLQILSGDTVDIIPLLQFHCWQKVYYKSASESVEIMVHVVGISEHCGNAITYKVLTAKTLKVVHSSSPCLDAPDNINMGAEWGE